MYPSSYISLWCNTPKGYKLYDWCFSLIFWFRSKYKQFHILKRIKQNILAIMDIYIIPYSYDYSSAEPFYKKVTKTSYN